jgi:uncharacterized membrane protein
MEASEMDDLYRVFKTLHVIAAIVLGGGFVMEALAGPLVARARTVAEVRVYAGLMRISENILSPAAALAILVFGFATADRSGIDMSTTWLVLGIIGFFVIAALAIAVLRPAANRLYRLAQAAPDGPVTPEIADQLKNRLPMITGMVTSVLFVFIIYLMVAKPAW